MPRITPILLIAAALTFSGCTFVIQAPIVCPTGTTLQDGRYCIGEVVGGGSVGAAGQGGGAASRGGGESLVRRIASYPDAGSSSWDTQVTALLLENFDDDDSGDLDTPREIGAVPCSVWKALDSAVRDEMSDGDETVPMLALYGFAQGYLWAGSALGIAEEMRVISSDKMTDCGLSTE